MSSFLSQARRQRRFQTGVVTGAVLGDPPPGRAGQVPPCEDEENEIRFFKQRMENWGGFETDDDKKRLAPKRWRPAGAKQ